LAAYAVRNVAKCQHLTNTDLLRSQIRARQEGLGAALLDPKGNPEEKCPYKENLWL